MTKKGFSCHLEPAQAQGLALRLIVNLEGLRAYVWMDGWMMVLLWLDSKLTTGLFKSVNGSDRLPPLLCGYGV